LATDDKEFYTNRLNLVETDGWIDLIEELKTLSESVKRIDSIDNEKDLWFARGQLSILRQMIVLEDATKAAMTELDL
jgi:hypothetical protein|tara:strand:- start:233 stop:463 length:231 start_codon:yes stop_codon:yes gene_type:complete